MNTLALRVYHALPPAGRTILAGVHGWRLQSWRYGPETDRFVQQALERDRWSPDRWRRWSEERLAYVLHRAATRVPYYRALWAERRSRGDSRSWERLENWPVLEKAALRGNPRAFVADDCDLRTMYPEQTSGTTGRPLALWWSRPTLRAWFALMEARVRLWNGVSRHDRWAILGGQLVVPFARLRPPFWVWNAPMHQLYLSSFHLSDSLLPHYLDALVRYRVTYLLGYSSCLHLLARAVLRLGRRDVGFKVVITNAEGLDPLQRETISEAFRCPVRETYGMAEIAAAASECEAGVLHQWPEAGVLEVEGDAGDLVCTGLLNIDMPLVRYRVGDSGALGAPSGCTCGRTLPGLAGIYGRTNDLLLTRDGRRVFWLTSVFYGLPVEEAQIIQEDLGCVRIRYTAAPGFSHATVQTLASRVRERLGDVRVEFERVDRVPREANGKFRAVVSRVAGREQYAGSR